MVKYRGNPERLIRRPRYRRIFGKRQPAWLVMEPNRLGLLGGSLFAFLATLYFVARNLLGAQLPPSQVLVGVGITFVISYAAVGIFVWYLLYVAEREFGPPPLEEVQRRSLILKNEKKAQEVPEGMDADQMLAALEQGLAEGQEGAAPADTGGGALAEEEHTESA